MSDPVRRQVVLQLAANAPQERACKEFELRVTKSTPTHHFRVLREAGVIAQRDEGLRRLNALRSEDLQTRFPGLLTAILRAGRE